MYTYTMNIFNKFKEFHTENKGKYKMPKAVNYPIDYKRASEWIEAQIVDEYKLFARYIIDNTQYISYKDFYDGLYKICKSYNSSRNKKTINVLIVPPDLYKSNIWVSLLAMDLLDDIKHIYTNVTDVFNEFSRKGSSLYGKNIGCIICDDCAYTGSQLSNLASIDYRSITFPGKKKEPDRLNKDWIGWYDDNSLNAKKYIDSIDISKFSVNIVVPFFTLSAMKVLYKHKYLKIPKDNIVLMNFSDYTDTRKFTIPVINEFRATFQYHNHISAIYFDHKVADAVSTFNKVYFLGPIFNTNAGIQFIDGCDNKIPQDIDVHSQYLAVEKETSTVLCPQTFYKSIKYTFKGKNITNFYEILE